MSVLVGQKSLHKLCATDSLEEDEEKVGNAVQYKLCFSTIF